VLVEWVTICSEVEETPGGSVIHNAGGVMGPPIELPATITVRLAVALLGLNEPVEVHTICWAVVDPDGVEIDQHKLAFSPELELADQVPDGLKVRRIVPVDCEFAVDRSGIYTLRCWALGQNHPYAVQLYVARLEGSER